jgi:hypothetical protein
LAKTHVLSNRSAVWDRMVLFLEFHCPKTISFQQICRSLLGASLWSLTVNDSNAAIRPTTKLPFKLTTEGLQKPLGPDRGNSLFSLALQVTRKHSTTSYFPSTKPTLLKLHVPNFSVALGPKLWQHQFQIMTSTLTTLFLPR